MHIAIGKEMQRHCPRTALVCVTAEVSAGPAPEALLAEFRAREQEVLRLPDPAAVLASPQVRGTREAYKALGKDPARYRGSAEALLRRIIAGKGPPKINAVVDAINLLSVESRLPVCLFDLAHVSGEITFRAGRAGETYKGIGKYPLNLEGLPVFSDALGPFGSPTSDSERTMVTAETRRILLVVISFSGAEDLERWGVRARELLELYAAAREITLELIQPPS
jgi:DNA/RNA-binding domain of Phe-tRNA-synthetase-like protein